ncbi:Protein Hook 2, partial [Cladochytrium tenue]
MASPPPIDDAVLSPPPGIDADAGPSDETMAEAIILCDGQWFKLTRPIESSDSWVLKFNSLKRLYKLLTGYYEEVLNQNTGTLDVPNLTAIARDSDADEIVKLAHLVLAVAVQVEQNQRYIAQIQSLDPAVQHALMVAIERDDLLSEKRELQSGLRRMEASMSQMSEAGKADFLMRTEMDNLKADMNKSENKRLEAELLAERQAATIKDLTKKLEDSSRKAEENVRLKDQLDEFRHFADKLQKSEALIEKYKKRIEETGDLRRQLKVLESQNQAMLERNGQLEEEYRKLSGFRPLMETYKEQIGSMEGQNSALMLENSKLDFELQEIRLRLEQVEMERKADQEQLAALEDQLREMELNQRDLERTKHDDKDERIQALERALDDAVRMKERLEKDYMNTFQRCLAAENEIKQ